MGQFVCILILRDPEDKTSARSSAVPGPDARPPRVTSEPPPRPAAGADIRVFGGPGADRTGCPERAGYRTRRARVDGTVPAVGAADRRQQSPHSPPPGTR